MRIAFISPHCLLDSTNGAATATLDGLKLLADIGFQCEVYCGTRVDAWDGARIEDVLRRRGERYTVHDALIGQFHGRMFFAAHGDVPVTMVDTEKDSPVLHCGGKGDSPIFARTKIGTVPREEIAAFLTGCEMFLDRFRPDAVWTYGGDPVALVVQQMAKQRGIPIVFALHNFSYTDRAPFGMADRVVVPTEFARRYYREKLELECEILPLVVDPDRVKVLREAAHPHPGPLPEGEGTFVTFVNPEPRKGIHVFARIAEVLSNRRPDIPLMLVEGASKASFLPKLGIDPNLLRNVRIMPNSPDARQFLAATRLLLMPSLMENAAVVAMEAMLNGIPVLASNRGALPETIGEAGFLFDIPARYTSETRDLPTAEEVELWVEAIIRLWDDAAEYDRRSRAARERAQAWHPDRLAPLYRDFFSSVVHQPGAALVPRGLS